MSGLFTKVDVTPIFRGYISTFKAYRSNSYSWGDVLFFLVVPFLIACLFVFLKVTVTQELSHLLLGLYSIFAGLFFGLQLFIFEIISKIVELNLTLKSSKLRIKKFEYIAKNISFEILICVLGLLILFLTELFTVKPLNIFFSGLSFYLLTVFVLGLLVIVKGIHILLEEEIAIQNQAVEDKFSKPS
jgi:hypothetical protein